LKFKLAAPRPAVTSAVVAIITDILSPGRVPRPRGFRVPLTDPTVVDDRKDLSVEVTGNLNLFNFNSQVLRCQGVDRG
jgi:hypothetical protein